jgi:modification methylase
MSESAQFYLPLDQVIHGDCIQVLESFPEESVDLVFADPPYNLQLSKELWRPNYTKVDAVDDAWDKFESYKEYDDFTRSWLESCKRVLKPNGTLWVIGTYHNIYRVGAIVQDLGFWTLNSIIWVKTNPMPNFRGVRFTNAHETLLWVQKERGAPYIFNHHTMKTLNGGKQMRSDWILPICSGKERLRLNGEKAHSTQKPEALLYRVIQASSNPGDIVLDPFFGTGTTGVVAKRLHRRWIGIEKEEQYVDMARQRIENVQIGEYDRTVYVTPEPRKQPRIPFSHLVEVGLLHPGQELMFEKEDLHRVRVLADGGVEYEGKRTTIHKAAKEILNAPANGWQLWYYHDVQNHEWHPIDHLRQIIRKRLNFGDER